MPRHKRIVSRPGRHHGLPLAHAQEIREDSIDIIVPIIHGYEMSPSEQPGIMPLAENRRFDAQGFTLQKGVPAAGEGMAVDIDEEFVLELLGEGRHWFHGEDVVVEGAIGHAGDGFREADVRVICRENRGVEMAEVFKLAVFFRLLGDDADEFVGQFRAVHLLHETLAVHPFPVVGGLRPSRSDAAPDHGILLLLPGEVVVFLVVIVAFVVLPVHVGREEDVAVDVDLAFAEDGHEAFGRDNGGAGV